MNISVVLTPYNQMSRFFSHLKDEDPIKRRSHCVYEICYGTCGKKHIGNTLQRLEDRIYQHRYALSHGEFDKSALALHVVNNSTHIINWDEPRILDLEEDKKKRFFKEMVYIAKERDTINRNDDISEFLRSYLPILYII